MIKSIRKVLLLLLVVALSMGSCTKVCYHCHKREYVCYLCQSSNDTIYVADWGETKILQQEIAYYGSNGYTCIATALTTPVTKPAITYSTYCGTKEDYNYYTWLGYDCYKEKK